MAFHKKRKRSMITKAASRKTKLTLFVYTWLMMSGVSLSLFSREIRHQNIVSNGMVGAAKSLLREELSGCTLALIGGGTEVSLVFSQLATSLNIAFQVSENNFDLQRPLSLLWRQSLCDTFFVFLQEGDMTTVKEYLHSKDFDTPWNYEGKYVFFSLSVFFDHAKKLEMEDLAKTHLLQKTQNVLFVWNRSELDEVEIWTHWLYSSRPFRFLAIYNASLGLPKRVELFPDKVSDLHGYTLVAKAHSFAPSVFGNVEDDGQTFHPVGGQDVDFVDLLAKHLNFTLAWKHPGPELWGTLLPNNTYTGIVGQVGAGDGDLGVTNIFVTIERSQYATFSFPYTYELACFITPAPRALPRWTSMTLPFTPLVWGVLFLSLFVTAMIYPIFSRFMVMKDLPDFYSFQKSLLITAAALTSQGFNLPKVTSLRLLCFFVVFACFIVSVCFSGNLTAYLTITSLESPIKTIAQLDRSKLRIIGFSSYWEMIFNYSTNPNLKALTPRYVNVLNTLPYFRDVADKRDAALVENRNHLEYIQKRFYTSKTGETPLRIQEECITTYSVGAIMNKHTPLKTSVDKAIHYMQAGALVEKFFKDVLIRKYHDSHHEIKGPSWLDLNNGTLNEDGPRALSLEHLQAAFFILGFGFALAFLIWVMEGLSTLCVKSTSEG